MQVKNNKRLDKKDSAKQNRQSAMEKKLNAGQKRECYKKIMNDIK